MRHLLISSVLLLATTGCDLEGNDAQPTYANVLPDDRVKISLPVDFSAEREAKTWSEAYLMTAQVTADVNGLIGGVLDAVGEVTEYDPTWTDDETTAVWGPFDDGALDPKETALTVHHDPATDIVTWVVMQRPKGTTDDEYREVIFGQVEAGATEEASAGWFAVDFDLIAELDPNDATGGKFVCSYEVDGDDVDASAAFEDFLPEDASEGPINALYHYEQVVGGAGLMDLIYETDVTGDGQLETSLMRSRWTADGAGRADSLAGGGELEDNDFTAYSSECWDTSFESVYYANNWEPTEDGNELSCAFDIEELNDTHEVL
jgi:hypothetical protein